MRSKLRELLAFRELLFALVVRELKVKYKGSVLGFMWSLVNPVAQMVVYTFVFSFVFRAGIEHFPLFLLAGLLPWTMMANSLTRATTSFIENANLIKKVYFPREIIPIAVVATNLVNFCLELLVLFVFLLIYGYFFPPFLPVLLLAVVLEVMFVVGLSLALSSASVYFRDLQQLIGLALMIWFYGTSVLYPIDFIPAQVREWLAYANPMNPIVSLYRDSLYYLTWPDWRTLVYAVVVAGVVFVGGYVLFSRQAMELAKEV